MTTHQTIALALSSIGRRVELMNLFLADARELGLSVEVVGMDASPERSPACHLAAKAVRVPRCDHPDFVPQMLRVCGAESVRILVPTINPELQPLAERWEDFRSIGTGLVICDAEAIRIARDKLATARALAAHGIPTPRSASAVEFFQAMDGWRWPVIFKPTCGSRSIGLHQANSANEALALKLDRTAYMVQERLSGREFTVNAYYDAAGCLRAAVPHERLEVRDGEVSKAVTRRVPALTDAARRMEKAVPGLRGPVCFQAMVAEDGACGIFEINARFGGGFPIAHYAGARFTRWILEEALGLPCTASDDWAENRFMLRYDLSVFGSAETWPSP